MESKIIQELKDQIKILTSKVEDLERFLIKNRTKTFETTELDFLDIQALIKAYKNEKIGKLVQDSFRYLVNNGKLSQDEILNLQNLNYCKIVFNISFKVLIKNTLSKHDIRGRSRYYAKEIVPGYWLNNHWVIENIDYFEKWLKRIN